MIIMTTLSPMSRDAPEKSKIDPVISDLNSWIYPNSSFALIVGTILYPISLVTMTVAPVICQYEFIGDSAKISSCSTNYKAQAT
jgi:hypothetical protein